ncbi:Hypothetical predicted protein [Octopus vulgaris]|uniref:Uncharacterized protein n=1 Tax=Octopus vulgaris TaxID=6645 RepID=A0AA36BSP3_OCTVU|nr:Hypothetical predicted protein [Octopus vulgaris]
MNVCTRDRFSAEFKIKTLIFSSLEQEARSSLRPQLFWCGSRSNRFSVLSTPLFVLSHFVSLNKFSTKQGYPSFPW